jgi:hypothetical protein
MQTTTIDQIEEKLRMLPPEKLAVVLDFVSYLTDRQQRTGTGEPDLAAWGMADYLANLEDYEERLARGEIQW